MKRIGNLGWCGIVLMLLVGCVDKPFSLKEISSELVYHNPPFASCHASTIEEVAPGKFLIAAFGGSHEGREDVNIWLASSTEKGWTQPIEVANGIVNDTLRYPAWNPVLFKTMANELFLFYKVGAYPAKWWGMAKVSKDNGATWGDAYALPEGILGPIKNRPIQLEDGTILSPSSTEQPTDKRDWKLHIEKSTDGGHSWEKILIDPKTAFNVIQPSILQLSDGRLQILCRSADDAIIQTFSDDKGDSWSALTKTNLPNPNSGTDAITLKNGWHVLVYNPTVTVSRESGMDWEEAAQMERSKLKVAISKDGMTWKDVVVLEDQDKGEFSYPTIMQASDGSIHITYTYDRVNVKHVVLDKV